MTLFNPISYFFINDIRYDDLTYESKKIIVDCVRHVNNMKKLKYIPSKTINIGHEGSCEWFHITLRDADDNSENYIIHSIPDYDKKYIVNFEDVRCIKNEDVNYVKYHKCYIMTEYEYMKLVLDSMGLLYNDEYTVEFDNANLKQIWFDF